KILQRTFHGVGAGGTVHALHHQNRLRQRFAFDLSVLGEIALLDGVVEHGEVVGDLQWAAMGPEQAIVRRGIGLRDTQQTPYWGRNDGLIHAMRVLQTRFHPFDLSQPLSGGLCYPTLKESPFLRRTPCTSAFSLQPTVPSCPKLPSITRS